LYRELDASTSSRSKQAALQRYLRDADSADAAWTVYFLAGGKPRQLVPTRLLRDLALKAFDLPEWLFEESYQTVGDLAETVGLLLPPATAPQERGLADWLLHHLLPLRGLPPEELTARLQQQWRELPDDQRLVYFKLITGGFRVGVSRLQVTQALAAVAGVDARRLAQRFMGYTQSGAQPTADHYLALVAPESTHEQDRATNGHPYPFFLAHPFAEPVDRFDTLLGAPADWQVEWKWDGIRAQLVRRAGQVWLWSRGEELITDRFPELAALGEALPDGTVVDGEIVIWRDGTDGSGELDGTVGGVHPFAELQKRITRKTVGPKMLRDLPAALIAYDLLEYDGADIRMQPQHARRTALESVAELVNHPRLVLSPLISGIDWPALAVQREAARPLGTEGFMLKHRDSRYGVGRTKAQGVWWKWKIDPMSVDAVLIYAQRGHGRRASLYSDYTFAVWDGPAEVADRKLVPFAKAYSGLTDTEMAQVDAIIRKTTVETFGPVRSVRPTLVFELGFEGLARSPRHKSGIAVRFPRMLRWREDKPVAEADTLQTLAALLTHSDP
jgi:DNA ligase-1